MKRGENTRRRQCLENELYENGMNINNQTVAEFVQKQNQLIDVRNDKIEGVMLRSKCRYMDLGEKPYKLFFSIWKIEIIRAKS